MKGHQARTFLLHIYFSFFSETLQLLESFQSVFKMLPRICSFRKHCGIICETIFLHFLPSQKLPLFQLHCRTKERTKDQSINLFRSFFFFFSFFCQNLFVLLLPPSKQSSRSIFTLKLSQTLFNNKPNQFDQQMPIFKVIAFNHFL